MKINHLALGVMALSLLVTAIEPAGAASFDCAKAETAVEKAICADTELSLLDERLAKTYQQAVHLAEDPVPLKKQQHVWLLETRSTCQDNACLHQALQTRIAELADVQARQWSQYRDLELGIEFAYPPQRHVRKNCHSSHHCVALVSTPMPAGSEYLLAFEVFDGDLAHVATNQAIFSRHSGGWVAQGRHGQYPVQFLSGEGWQGIYAVVDCGVTSAEGVFHAAGGECYWAVLSNGLRSVTIDSEGLVGNDELSRRSIESFRFIQ